MKPARAEQWSVDTTDESAEYVFVQQGQEDIGISDDNSYDYCDDVFSVGSASDSDPVGEAQVPKEVVLTVPSMLMKNLDEAHAAAELASISDLDPSVVDDEPAANKGLGKGGRTSTKAPVTSTSRLSNKKRRKQLKLMKKAQAAANAAKVPTRPRTSPQVILPKTTGKKATSTPASKNVANIAMACAAQTFSAYRQPVHHNNKQLRA